MTKKKTYGKFNTWLLPVIAFLCIVIFLGLKVDNNPNKYKKLKILTKVLRLLDEQYVEDVDFDSLVEGAISGMISTLDPHSAYINKNDFQKSSEEFDGEFEGIGIEFSIIDDYITVMTPIIDGPSYKAGIQAGDKIVKINGESAYQIKTSDVVKKLKGPKGTQVTITIKRGNEDPFERTLIRDKIPIKSVVSYFNLDDNVGYIKLSRFSKKTISEFITAFEELEKNGMDKLLIDLRNNPGGLLDQAVSMLDMFISSNDTLLYTKGRIYGSNEVFKDSPQFINKKIPIITIINRGSASASEIVSGAFQDLDRGLVIGETSFGKGSVQRQYELDDSTATRITIAKYYTPSGRSIQRSYASGKDEYYLDLNSDNRELTDSTKNLKPQFKTRKGRTVYGGGGITPDIYFKDTTVISKPTLELLYNSNRPIFNYAITLKSSFDTNTDFDEFSLKNNFYEFIDWLDEKDYEYNKDSIEKDWDLIETRIVAEIANQLFDRNQYYKKLISNDIIVNEAIKHFEEAKALLN
tara:strand:- start:1908 stop:3473 length:1566 start_codon:yes stop_codon:yes gene_type:complete